MPDAVLRATERQFRRLVTHSTRAGDIDFHVFYMPEAPRGAAGERHCRAHYLPHEALFSAPFDTLIVTGCEPRAGSLRDEPFWPGFTALVDWARTHTRSALWSCLAAHAAVLHLDGIERQRFPRKLSGIFTSERTGDHALLAGVPDRVRIPHSRHNTLAERDLLSHGYEILTRSDRIGPDVFAKATPSLFLFLQGHPEYERDSLGREYRRDLDRFLTGASATAPVPPENYFDPAVAARLDAVVEGSVGTTELGAAAALLQAVPGEADWHGPAAQIYRNWLSLVAEGLQAEQAQA